MSGRLKSVYASGWSPAKKAMLDQVVMPEKTRCQSCGVLKATAPQNYSEKKLQDLRSAIAHGQARRNPSGKWIACRTCVGAQVAELECSHCNEWKGLKDFTKAQRRNPDRARCIDCVANHLEEDPIHGNAMDHYANKELDQDSDSDDGVSNAYEDSMTESSAGGVYISNHNYEPLTSQRLAELDLSSAGPSGSRSASLAVTSASIADTVRNPSHASAAGIDKWQKIAGRGPLGAAAGTTFVGYDAQGRAYSQIRAPSTTGSDGSDESTATTTAEKHDARPLNRSNFAKIKGTKGKPAFYRPEKTANRTVTLNDYDDDNDEVDEGDDYFTY